jgi:hypothetical protein
MSDLSSAVYLSTYMPLVRLIMMDKGMDEAITLFIQGVVNIGLD